MNLFTLDADPIAAATMLSDQHVRKMILETAQIMDGGTRPIMYNLYPSGGPYEIVSIPRSQRDNPCILSSGSHVVWDWAWGHFLGLLGEYHHRTGKRHSYQTDALIKAFMERRRLAGPGMSGDGFRLFMPDAYKTVTMRHVPLAHAVVSYRAYYAGEKRTFEKGPALWTRRAPPLWLVREFEYKGARRQLTADGKHYFFTEQETA